MILFKKYWSHIPHSLSPILSNNATLSQFAVDYEDRVVEYWECDNYRYFYGNYVLYAFSKADEDIVNRQHIDDITSVYHVLSKHFYYLMPDTYSICLVGKFDSNDGTVGMDFVDAKPQPFPDSTFTIELYYNQVEEKYWAISADGEHGFSKSERSFNTWMHFEYKTTTTRDARILAKTRDGYVNKGTFTFDHTSHSPS